jgi:D-glycero-D-manno-heptose 1,7-bisphosphate phosphatase
MILEKHRAIFLDRDGVINANRSDHVKSWDEFVFLPNSLFALQKLAATDHKVIVITNQAAIARGIVCDAMVREIHTRMIKQVEFSGGRIDAVYYCPHHPDAKCNCRKPQPGLFRRAAIDFALDLSQSFVIGDACSDISAAFAIGAYPIMVMTGRGRAQHAELLTRDPIEHRIFDDLLGAVDWILSGSRIVR